MDHAEPTIVTYVIASNDSATAFSFKYVLFNLVATEVNYNNKHRRRAAYSKSVSALLLSARVTATRASEMGNICGSELFTRLFLHKCCKRAGGI